MIKCIRMDNFLRCFDYIDLKKNRVAPHASMDQQAGYLMLVTVTDLSEGNDQSWVQEGFFQFKSSSKSAL